MSRPAAPSGFFTDGLVRRAAIARSLVRTLKQRFLTGPRHPSWPFPFELTMGLMRAMLEVDHHGAALAQRRRPSVMPPSLFLKIKLTHEQLAGVPVDVLTPVAYQPRVDPTLLYLHGGGYVTCSPASHRHVLATLASVTGARVFAPAYRLAPEHPFPAALDDVEVCYRELLARGVRSQRLFVGGDSAGGGLALALQLRMRDAGFPLARALLLLSPWVDLSLQEAALTPYASHDYLTPRMLVETAPKYAGSHPLDHPLISPVYADLAGLPPTLLLTGAWELFLEQNVRFAVRARTAGVDIKHVIEPGMLHAYPAFAALIPQGRAALRAVGQYVRALVDKDAPLSSVDAVRVP